MPLLQNAKKAARSSEKKRSYNQRVRSQMKTAIDAVKKSPTLQTVNQAFSSIDKAVKRNIIHSNKAGRIKSQLSKLVVSTTK